MTNSGMMIRDWSRMMIVSLLFLCPAAFAEAQISADSSHSGSGGWLKAAHTSMDRCVAVSRSLVALNLQTPGGGVNTTSAHLERQRRNLNTELALLKQEARGFLEKASPAHARTREARQRYQTLFHERLHGNGDAAPTMSFSGYAGTTKSPDRHYADSRRSGASGAKEVGHKQFLEAFQAVLNDSKVSDSILCWFNFRGADKRTESPPGITPEDYQDAKYAPQDLGIELSYRFGGGAVVYGGPTCPHIFPNDFFARHFDRNNEDDPEIDPREYVRKNLRRLTTAQPWLEWTPNGRFRVHQSGASLALLEVLLAKKPQTIKLYRGTTILEATVLRLLAFLNRRKEGIELVKEAKTLEMRLQKHAATIRPRFQHVAKAVGTTLKEILSNPDAKANSSTYRGWVNFLRGLSVHLAENSLYRGFFTTNSVTKAGGFSKGAVITYRVPAERVLKLAQSGAVYVGVEGTVEIGFFTPEAVLCLVHGFVSDREAEVSEIWSE